MQMKNKGKAKIKPEIKQISKDPVLRRIQVQSKIIKRIPAEIEQPLNLENDRKTDDEVNPVVFEYEEKDGQK
jgi:hypothetical protein